MQSTPLTTQPHTLRSHRSAAVDLIHLFELLTPLPEYSHKADCLFDHLAQRKKGIHLVAMTISPFGFACVMIMPRTQPGHSRSLVCRGLLPYTNAISAGLPTGGQESDSRQLFRFCPQARRRRRILGRGDCCPPAWGTPAFPTDRLADSSPREECPGRWLRRRVGSAPMGGFCPKIRVEQTRCARMGLKSGGSPAGVCGGGCHG